MSETSSPSSRPRIGGIKLSPELALHTSEHPFDGVSMLPAVFEGMSTRKINVFYLTQNRIKQNFVTRFCTLPAHLPAIHNLASQSAPEQLQISSQESVGIVTLFPHRNQLGTLGRVLTAFDRYQLPVHDLCTSISAVSIVTDYTLLDRAVAGLEETFILPENHAPFRSDFSVTQSDNLRPDNLE